MKSNTTKIEISESLLRSDLKKMCEYLYEEEKDFFSRVDGDGED